MILELLAGLCFQTKPENGTWWDQALGVAQFRQVGGCAGAGVRGDNWAVEAQFMGREFSTYTDQNSVQWNGEQKPVTVEAIWEPHIGSIQGRFGLGVSRPQFSMNAIGPGVQVSASNDRIAPSYVAGVRAPLGKTVSIIADARYVYARVTGAESVGNFPNLGKFAVFLGIEKDL